MNNPEAKFILGAYRPDGRDAHDPAFAEALAQAARDPELGAWLERHRRFDTMIAGRIAAIAPPPGLREAILAGARASQPARHWWTQPTWLAAAAALVLLAAAALTLRPRATSVPPAPSAQQLAALALDDLATAHDDHVGRPADLTGVRAQLASVALPLPRGLALDRAELRRHGCRTVAIGGREVFELCFQRDGTWYHLYVARRADFAPGTLDPRQLLAARGDYASTVWADGENVYALVTRAGAGALRRVI